MDPGSVVGIATGYGLNGAGIESRWGLDFPHLSRPALGPTYPSVQYDRVFPGVKERPGRDADPCIAPGYELDGPGIESRWGRDFPRLSRPALGPT